MGWGERRKWEAGKRGADCETPHPPPRGHKGGALALPESTLGVRGVTRKCTNKHQSHRSWGFWCCKTDMARRKHASRTWLVVANTRLLLVSLEGWGGGRLFTIEIAQADGSNVDCE